MASPFLFLALCLAAGIFVSSFVSASLSTWLLFLVISLVCAWFFFSAMREKKTSFVLILLTTFFLGSSLYTFHNNRFEKKSIHTLPDDAYIDFYGKLYKSPSRGRKRDYLYLKIENVLDQDIEIKGNLRVSIPYTKESSQVHNLHTLDEIKVSAKLSHSQGYRNFNTSSLDQYLKSQNLHKRAFTKSPLLVEKLKNGNKLSPLRIISILRRKFQLSIEKHFLDSHTQTLSPQGAVVEALLLGERGRMNPEFSLSLQSAGIYHLFAISGAHIAIISFLLFSFFKLLRIPNRTNYILLILFLSFFALLVEGRPSVLRATIMAFAFLFGKLIWRNVNLLNTLSIAAFFLLLFNPFNLFSLGFQLTFVATLSIILFFPKIIKHLPKLPLRMSEIFALSLAAQLGVLPLIAWEFNRVTFSSLILNIAAIPLVGLIMACGYIFLPLTFTIAFAAEILSRLIHFLIDLLMDISHIFDPFPALSFRVPTPSVIIIFGYFLFFGLILLPTRIRKQKLITGLLFIAFLALLVTYPFSSHSKNLKITFIDVGQGDSILVEFPGRKKMLVDGGGIPEETFDIGERVVSPFLWKKGIKKIDFLVLTHAHPDHMNGLKAVARNFRIDEYWEAFSPKDNESYAELRRLLSGKTISRRMFRGHEENIDGVKIEILNPNQADPYVFRVHNNHSLVLRLIYDQTPFLLSSDIEKEVEDELEESYQTLSSQILKSPHHGSDSSSSEDFLKAVSPQVLIISVGKGNRYNLPDQAVLDRYEEIEAKVYRTDQVGAVEISSDGKRISVRVAAESR